MKKICISIAVFLAVFMMTGCETYEDNLKAALTETSTAETTELPAFELMTDTVVTSVSSEIVSGDASDVTSVPESAVSDDSSSSAVSISLDYEAIASAVTTAPADATDTSSSEETTTTEVTSEYSSEDGRPPLPDDLKDFYTSALEVYSKIYYCSFTSDTSTPVWVNGKDGYTRVTDTRFPDYQSLYTFASYYFTDDLMTNQILPYGQTSFVDKYGAFYMAPATNTKNPAYAGHVFRLVSQTDSEIVCTADVYYLLGNGTVNTDPIFFTEPADKSKYAVSQLTFRLTKFEDRWKFSQFAIIN